MKALKDVHSKYIPLIDKAIKQLRKVLTAMSTDLKAIDKYLAARAEGGSEVPPASYETTKAIDAVGNNYGRLFECY